MTDFGHWERFDADAAEAEVELQVGGFRSYDWRYVPDV